MLDEAGGMQPLKVAILIGVVLDNVTLADGSITAVEPGKQKAFFVFAKHTLDSFKLFGTVQASVAEPVALRHPILEGIIDRVAI